MPRKSAAALSVVSINTAHKPPRTPEGLSLKAKAIFAELVASVPASHFREADWPLIEQLAIAILNVREAQRMVDKHGLVHKLKVSPWTLALEKQQKVVASLAVRLRMSPQSRYDRKSKSLTGPSQKNPRPWTPHDDSEPD